MLCVWVLLVVGALGGCPGKAGRDHVASSLSLRTKREVIEESFDYYEPPPYDPLPPPPRPEPPVEDYFLPYVPPLPPVPTPAPPPAPSPATTKPPKLSSRPPSVEGNKTTHGGYGAKDQPGTPPPAPYFRAALKGSKRVFGRLERTSSCQDADLRCRYYASLVRGVREPMNSRQWIGQDYCSKSWVLAACPRSCLRRGCPRDPVALARQRRNRKVTARWLARLRIVKRRRGRQ